MRLVIVLIVLLWAMPAKSHSWYPAICCGGQDCREITDVEEVKGGYMVMHKWFRAYGQVLPSPDGNFHACTFHALGDTDEKLRCFFAPQNSM